MGKPVQFQIKPDKIKGSQKKFRIQEDNKNIIDGIILEADDKPVANAVVKLYIINKATNNLEPSSYTFTDQYGEFAFGPVDINNEFLIKVWYDIKEDSPIKLKVEPINDLATFLNETNLETAEFCSIECEVIDNMSI